MSKLEKFKKYIKEQIVKYPSLKEEIVELYDLAIMEIEEGSSIDNEISLCEDSIKELIK